MGRAEGLAVALILWLPGAAAGGELVGDTVKGMEIYSRCGACHSLERNRSGPKHCGLIGRPAGSLEDFIYSKALKASALVWDRATLDRFIADPLATVPGTFMGYAGISDPQERADLIAYLADAGATCP
jgi:cytochrome c